MGRNLMVKNLSASNENKLASSSKLTESNGITNSKLTKSDLLEVLKTSKSSKENNRAVKLLKQFERKPKYELDTEAEKGKMKIKQTKKTAFSFLCYRCDWPKQALVKVIWTTSKGMKEICLTCHQNLTHKASVRK